MKFAQFQSTYKPLPLDVYERTGQQLETKYYKNREDASLLRQGLSNLKVEDRNIGHLAKATSDVEGMLENVSGKWHYASNILYNAKDRIIGDKALAASMEDYAKSQAAKQNEQKRMEEGKIGQDALSAFYINEKRYNNKAVEVDKNGQVINRWNTPTAPPKVDTEKKIIDIVTLLNQHKDSLGIPNKKGDDIFEFYEDNPRLEGFVNKYIASGKSPEKIASAVREWINTTPEIKAYNNYINDAILFNSLTEKDEKGNYIQDENGEFLQRSLTAKDFRDIGFKVTDDWQNLANTIDLPEIGGILTKSVIRGISPNFKETEAYQNLRENGFSDNEALQKLYVSATTDLQTEKLIDFSKAFAYSEVSSQTIKNDGYWIRAQWAHEEEKSKNIHNIFAGEVPMYKSADFDSRLTLKTIKDRQDQLSLMPNVTPTDKLARRTVQNQINDLQNSLSTLANSFNSSVEGNEVLTGLYGKVVKLLENTNNGNLIKGNEENIKNFISGKSSELGFTMPEPKISNSRPQELGSLFASTSILKNATEPASLVRSARREYSKALTKRIQKDGLPIQSTTSLFLNDKGEISDISKNLGKLVMQDAYSWEFPSAYNKQGQSLTVADFFKKNGISSYNYETLATITDPTGANPGYYAIKIIPKAGVAGADKLKIFDKMVIRPGVRIRGSIQSTISDMVINDGANNNVKFWGIANKASAIFGDYFTPIKQELAIDLSIGGDGILKTPKNLYEIPVDQNDSNKTINAQIKYIKTPSKSYYEVRQLDKNDNPSGEVLIRGNSLNDIQISFFQLFSK